MKSDRYWMTVGGIDAEVVRKPIKHLRIGVYPPDGRVRVSAPLAVSDEAVRLAVLSKMGWIEKHRARMEAQARQARRERADGEVRCFLGRRYRLRVVEQEGAGGVTLVGMAAIEVCVRAGAGEGEGERVLERWYREQLRLLVPPLLERWEPALGVRVAEWGIRRMKTRWGSCNPRARRIWLNLELVKRPPRCLEYIVVHEMAHLLERSHNGRFRAIMDEHLPSWRLVRDDLKGSALRDRAALPL
jgi:predicted metal-dependent hydrolase